MKFVTHKTERFTICGTSLMGFIPESITYTDLVEIFGEPLEGNYKTDAEWHIQFDDKTIANIYNYKNGVNYLGKEEGINVWNMQGDDWHIGGYNLDAVNRVNDAINEYMNKI